jgi:two-component system response regulator NreC
MNSALRLVHAPISPDSTGPGEPIRVLLADPHLVMRRSLRLLLDGERDLQVVAETGALTDIMRQISMHDPHALVIDVSFPGGGSLQAIRGLRRRSPELSIIATGLHEGAAFGRAAIQAGADGYVLKEQADTLLPDAIRALSPVARTRVSAS